MAITIDGDNKIINLSTSTDWLFHDIYVALVDWSYLPENMKYLLPCQGNGKVDLGGGVYTDIIYNLLNGWKLKPSGYVNGTQILVEGTLVTDDGSIPTDSPTVGGIPQWLFKVATYGVLVEGGSGGGGLTTAEHDQLMEVVSTKADVNNAAIIAGT
jgi:hypothetical protein